MLNFIKELFSQLKNPDFWENGTVMIVTCLIISLILVSILWSIGSFKTTGYKKWLPAIICIPIIIIGFIMLFFPNGTGGVTQHFYLGILLYALCIMIFTGIAEAVIITLQNFKHKS